MPFPHLVYWCKYSFVCYYVNISIKGRIDGTKYQYWGISDVGSK